MRRLIGYHSISVSEYNDGDNHLLHVWMDGHSKRMLTEHLERVEQSADDPFYHQELLLMAALEVYARFVDPHGELF